MRPEGVWSRRRVLRRGVALTAGVTAAGRGWRAAAAQTAPAASPTAHPDLLIEPSRLLGRRPAASPVIVALKPAEEFAAGHIPGATRIDWPAFEVIDTSDESIARWRGEIEQTLAALGIGRESAVVTYDGGTLFAARLWWILHYLGHAAGNRVLHGGLAAWHLADGEVREGAGEALMADTAAPYQGEPQPAVLAQLTEVQAALDDPAVIFVDARTPEEYAAGHIPGAVNLNYPLNVQAELPATWKPVAELRAMYERLGVTPDKTVIPYCSSGVRSAVTFFTLRLIGYPTVALYTGSWQEWERVPGLPIAES